MREKRVRGALRGRFVDLPPSIVTRDAIYEWPGMNTGSASCERQRFVSKCDERLILRSGFRQRGLPADEGIGDRSKIQDTARERRCGSRAGDEVWVPRGRGGVGHGVGPVRERTT